MGPFKNWCVSAGLDAYSYAAAGRKLALNEGLGREKLPAKKKDREGSLSFELSQTVDF
jgi:hypothetical protein